MFLYRDATSGTSLKQLSKCSLYSSTSSLILALELWVFST
ncbi:unnamed protein product [Tenebrio molitor]|nr:unnamed protein product [Tenebrio molitor]